MAGEAGRVSSPRREAYIALIDAFATRWPDATEPPVTELAKVALDVLMPKEPSDESCDRTVHAEWDQMQVVRYDKAGKWYLEPVGFPGLPRQAVKIGQAVDYALWAWSQPGGAVHLGRYGGGTFDARVRKACKP